MRTTRDRWAVAVWAIILLLALVGWATGAESSATRPDTYKGTIRVVDQKERTFTVQGFWSDRTFNVGDHCKVSLEDKPEAELKDLRPGQRVEVSYVNNNGVRIASHVTQKNLLYTGNIASIDPTGRTLKIKHGLMTETFVARNPCNVIIRGDRDKSLSDLKIGHKVTVSYVAPGGGKVAERIEQLGSSFTGTVEAIDADDRTLKAQHLLSEKKFVLAKDCPIVLAGKSDGKLRDLRIGDKLTVQYEESDGVLIATTIAREAPSATPTPSAQVTKTESPEP